MDPDAYFVFVATVFGLIFGSFATAFAYRVPRKESMGGRSKCPNCGRQITAIENIPVFSWIFLRGKCRGCKNPISIRYPLIEASTAALFAGSAAKFGLSVEAFLYAAFFWTLVVLTVIDLEFHLLPNKITYPAFVVGLVGLTVAALVDDDLGRMTGALLGALVYAGFFFVIAFIYPSGMGLGDVKLAATLGLFLGYLGFPGHVFVAFFFTSIFGGVVAVVMVMRGAGRKAALPFGPLLVMGTIVAVFWGQKIIDAYLGT